MVCMFFKSIQLCGCIISRKIIFRWEKYHYDMEKVTMNVNVYSVKGQLEATLDTLKHNWQLFV